MSRASPPSLAEERSLWDRGLTLIAGIDEAGRGPLAGPVVAGAVILPAGVLPAWLGQVRDSKELSPSRREYLSQALQEEAVAAVGVVSVEDIDRLDILKATRKAMALAVVTLPLSPHFLLIDALRLPDLPMPQKSIIRGDKLCLSIAAASIVAKVTRDGLMRDLDALYPEYGFARHKGYATKEHLQALHRLGPCPAHRRSFAPVKGALSAEEG